MRLKHLELHGYKSFAARTEFSFDGGITAIVGPNGSGKSNIADGIRWVLGEQSYRVLRGKRTEDMIFSGSSQRARLGMASVSLVLDNSDGWLPIDFSEITITRRAYRSGENEYLLNGQRVRLRDITELLAKSGLAQRTYTVVGQGLVDAVLSLRPEDRRVLFEEAAGITLYQTKRAEALARLDETHANLTRVQDIIAEIAPRLRRLEREAERASHYRQLEQQLKGLLRIWYGYRWHSDQRELIRAREAVTRHETALAHLRETLTGLDEQMAALRARQAELRDQLGAWHRQSSELHRQMERVQRDLAVWQERSRWLAHQADEARAELAEMELEFQTAMERMTLAEAETEAAHARWQQVEEQVTQIQQDLTAHEARRQALSQEASRVQAQLFDLAAQATDRRNRLVQIGERTAALDQERNEQQKSLTGEQASRENLLSRIESLTVELTRLQTEKESQTREAAGLEQSLADIQARRAELRAALAEAERTIDRLQARHELLTRLRAEGEGFHAGVRAVLRAAGNRHEKTTPVESPRRASPGPQQPMLSGILGTVAQLIQVPEHLEIAIEVALGSHLQDLVVESWADAESAIAFLRQGKHGRATFLPLDTVRPLPRLALPNEKGIVGLAADLVLADGRLKPVVEMLLGRTLVVHDLSTARRVFEQLRGGFQIVTLAGDILRSSGSVTGGTAREGNQGGVLAREREWRELPAQIEAAHEKTQQLVSALAEAQADEQRVRDQAARLRIRIQEMEEAIKHAQLQRQNLERDLALIDQQLAWRRERIAQLDRTRAELAEQERTLHAELAHIELAREETDRQSTALQAELDGLHEEQLYQRLLEARTAATVAHGAWEHRRSILEGMREQQAQLQAQIQARRARLTKLEQEKEALLEQIGQQSTEETVIHGWLDALLAQIEPAEAEVAALELQYEDVKREEAALRLRLRQAESLHTEAVLAQNRCEDRLERLRRQIVDDFGLVEIEPTEGLPEQPPLPLVELVSTLPTVEALPEGLEEEIHQLKAQLRRMGPVNLDAPREYEEVRDRYTFLTTQAADLEEAGRRLREIVAELDALMRREFETTFKAVAERFKKNFSQLFGGGSARLLLTDPEDLNQTGIEIIAQPPGKRQQTLALLSGGERALTAVALLFSILEVRPPPFCILDEVDAMLDETNVRRFRQALEALSQQTQFIVITHNRGTIQAANTIYGVSMGDDSASQVVSLRLDGNHQLTTVDGSPVGMERGR